MKPSDPKFGSRLFRLFTVFALLVGVLFASPVQAQTPIHPLLTGSIFDTFSSQTASPNEWVVTNTNDSGAGSLRQAIADAASGDKITFSPSLSGQTTTLATTLVIAKNLTIDGSALASKINISGNNNTGVFQIASNAVVTIKNIIIINGSGWLGGGIKNDGTLNVVSCSLTNNTASYGGGIYNNATLTITNSTFSMNTADVGGGGILHYNGLLTISNSTFSSNDAQSGGGLSADSGIVSITNSIFANNTAVTGGGINSSYYAALTVMTSTFSGNSVSSSGGGILNNSASSTPLTVTGSTFSENSAQIGGGIANTRPLILSNSTFYKNSASELGGGISNSYTTATVNNSTFSDNSATYFGGGIANWYNSTMILKNTIIANSTSGGDCYNVDGSVIETALNNLIESNAIGINACGTPVSSNDPVLGPLENNGGPTQTMTLGMGSPAIDAGDDTTCAAIDQRGFTRPQGARCDIGAYEYSLATFADVPVTYWASDFIERLYANNITGGCSTYPPNYCPAANVTRGQMAVFLLKGMYGKDYIPVDATGTIFNDVPADNGLAKWIEQLYTEGITGGCGNGNYCPNNPVTREQMAVFLLVAEHGIGYAPPAATGVFNDVPADNPFAKWIEALADEGITGGCGEGNFCPKGTVTRAQMAVFLVTAFNLP
jgi:hypothetical protein